METSARYTLIGSFVVTVIAIGFAFVYWLHAGGGLGQRASYHIRYDGTVGGLLKGSTVLFNGIRVGEVTRLVLDPANPDGALVEIAIESQTPVRQDTRASIDFQGLAGAPVVTLAGGSKQLPLLKSDRASPPILAAETGAGQGVSQTAREVLRNIDRVVSENAEPLRSLIANLDKFSVALARNSDRVDGLISGLERFTSGTSKSPARIYDLPAATAFPGLTKRPQSQLLLPEATTLSMFDSDRVVLRDSVDGKPVIDNAQWPDLLPKIIQARLIQSFENAGLPTVIGRAPDGLRIDFHVAVDVRSFSISARAREVRVELAVKIFSTDGRIVGSRSFTAAKALDAIDAPTATAMLAQAFELVAGEIVVWVCSLI